MESFAATFNKTCFTIDTTDFEYVKLSTIYNSANNGGGDVVHNIDGVFVNKSPLGWSPVIIDEENRQLVNLPQHMAETCNKILACPEAVQAIRDKKVGYVIYTYESRGKTCYSIRFVDK